MTISINHIFRVLLYAWLLAVASIFCSARIFNSSASGIESDSLRREIGRHLFYDKRLSVNGIKSCSSCHDQRYAFSDGYRTSLGAEGVPLKRNSPGLFNLESLRYYTWADNRIISLQSQMQVPLFNEHPVEMGFMKDVAALKNFLLGDTYYGSQLPQAFPEREHPYTIDEVQECIVDFMLQFKSLNAEYDKYVAGETKLDTLELKGMRLFYSDSVGCGSCHAGIFFTNATINDTAYFNTGIFQNTSALELPDSGLFEATHDPADIGKFRVPTLRNLAYTAPYMHNGSMRTLSQVIEHYVQIGQHQTSRNRSVRLKTVALQEADRQALISFLLSLSDSSLITNDRLSDPFKQ